MDGGSSDAPSLTEKRLLNRLLILPAFAAIITMVIVFLGITWSIRALLLLLPKVKSFLRSETP